MTAALTIPVITDDMSQPEAALALAAVGVYVFPVDHPDLPQCAGMKTASHDPATCPADERGKHPVLKFTVGADDVNPKMIHMWGAGARATLVSIWLNLAYSSSMRTGPTPSPSTPRTTVLRSRRRLR